MRYLVSTIVESEKFLSRVIFISDTTSFGILGSQRYIGPYTVAFALENSGFDTIVIDYYTRHANFFDYFSKFLTSDTIAIGISTTFISPYYTQDEVDDLNALTSNVERYNSSALVHREIADFHDWLQELRNCLNAICPKAKIIIGGAKTQALLGYDQNLLKNIDYFLWGAADGIISEVMKDIESGNGPVVIDYNNHKVIDTVSHYKTVKHCPRFNWLDKWAIQPDEALPIEISRGCVFNCKYCHYEKKESFKKDLEDLRLEFISNYERFGTTKYHFCDDCFNDSRAKVEAVCGMILELPFKIEWISYARVDVAIKFPETADLMVRSGARGLHWGIESLTHKVALKAGKGTPSESVKAFLQDFYEKHGRTCFVHGSFITGLPGETHETQMETIDWVINHQALHFVTVGPLKLFPYKASFDGSAMDFSDYSRTPEKYGFKKISFNPPDWEHETMNHEQALSYSGLFFKKWRASNPRRDGPLRTIWNYPHLRGLGFTEEEIQQFYFSQVGMVELYKKGTTLFLNRLKNYYNDLLSKNQR